MHVIGPFLLAASLLAPGAVSPGVTELEQEVKAAYLFKFLSYVEWPAASFSSPEAPIVIGVLDADDVYGALQVIVQGRTAQGRRVEIRRVTDDDAGRVHLVFVGRAALVELPRFSRLAGVLVVGESESSIERGAMIGLVRAGDHVGFQVAPDVAERSGLHISSRMLAVAQSVKAGP